MIRLLAIMLLTGLPALAGEATRTWDAALTFVPTGDGPEQIRSADLPDWLTDNPDTPVVVYGHGCDGVGRITRDAGRFIASEGWAFIAPDSFARLEKPRSCDVAAKQGGLHRAVLGWRHEELDEAVARVRAATDAPVAMMGHSEGAIAAATYEGHPLSARIIEGWTCHAGWPEYSGLSAPATEPVLALVAENDPWFAAPVLRGDCGEYMDDNDRSVVFRGPGYLHKRHWLTSDREVKRIVSNFLAEAFSASSGD